MLVRNLVLAGFLTNCCVESAMRTGFENGFHIITLADCMAATLGRRARRGGLVHVPDVLDRLQIGDFASQLS
jgi:nicotinamidase-related amidase